MTDPSRCGRPGITKSAICDPGDLLSKESKDVTEGFMNDIKAAQLAVLVVKKIDPSYIGFDEVATAAEKFAKYIHNAWGVGDKASNNGVMIFLSVDDRRVHISTGKGSAQLLTLSLIDAIISHMRADLRAAEYGAAIEKCVVEIGLVFEGKDVRSNYEKLVDETQKAFAIFLFGCFCIFAVGSIVLWAYDSFFGAPRRRKGDERENNLIISVLSRTFTC